MAKYINADALLAEAKKLSGPMTGDGWSNWGVYALIERQPAADVEPVRHGRWVKSPECPEEYDICSICGRNDKHRTRADQEHPAFESLPLYCKWCGAKMGSEVQP